MPIARSILARLSFLLLVLAFGTAAHAQLPPVTFTVTIDPAARNLPATGRLIVLLKKSDANLPPEAEPLDGPFWDDPQPLYGIDITDIPPGTPIVIDDSSTSFPREASSLLSGDYVAQARLDINRDSSAWRDQSGNMFSKPVTFTRDPKAPTNVDLVLSEVTRTTLPETDPRVDVITIESPSLTAFAGKTIRLRAAVVKPLDFDATRHYPAVYEVPGFGGTHLGAYGYARRTASDTADPATKELARNSYWIVLDPESANGHTLFADSANNGPRGEALIRELIPEIEKRHNLINNPEARLLRGHSSGGWSTLWLALVYPNVFGRTWSTAPDPVDFRAFQNVDIYKDVSMYTDTAGEQRPSFRRNGKALMTIRQENAGEQVLGPNNSSAQQWDSWQAVWGPRDAKGHPAALYDPKTGNIDRGIAEQYAKYDISRLLKADPSKYVPLFQNNIRLFVGDQDSFFLNLAVELLQKELNTLAPAKPDQIGTIVILPGYDHGNIFQSPEVRAFPSEMLGHLRSRNIIPQLKPEPR